MGREGEMVRESMNRRGREGQAEEEGGKKSMEKTKGGIGEDRETS